MNKQQEKREFEVFMQGLEEEIKRRNRLMGREILPQAQWNTLSEQEKNVAVAMAILRLSPHEMAILLQKAHDAIHDINH